MITGDWQSKSKSVTMHSPVKEGSNWKGRNGILLLTKVLKDGDCPYHFVVGVRRREVWELQGNETESSTVNTQNQNMYKGTEQKSVSKQHLQTSVKEWHACVVRLFANDHYDLRMKERSAAQQQVEHSNRVHQGARVDDIKFCIP